MKKSELRKYISEALTPDEASKVEPKYKETYAAMIRGKGPLKLKKYDNPDKVVLGRVINNLKESTRRTNERLEVAIKEVFSEKQRKYMCVMAQPGAKRPKGLSKADAKEMCADTKISKAKQEEQALEEIDNLMNETGQEIAKKNMDDYKRLNELVKAALMGPISEKQASTDKYDDNPALKGKQSELPDGLQKAIIKKAGGKVEEDKMTPEERALDRKIRRAYGLDKGAPDPDMPHFKNIFKDDAITIPNLKERILRELRGNINEALNKDLKDVGMDIAKYLKGKGLEPKFIQGENLKLYQDFPENGSLFSLMDGGARLEIAVHDSKIDTLKEIIKRYNLKPLQSLKQTGGWADDPKKKAQSEGEIYISSDKPLRAGKAFKLELRRFDPSTIM